ncbi:MAG: toll/interleukin-1 receptor domain-containing protein [Planctomycetota bacterium]
MSYANQNVETVTPLVRAIESMGEAKCWYFGRDNRHGESYLQTIELQVTRSALMVLIVSADSLKSPEVDREVRLAHQARISILPVFLDGSSIDSVRGASNGWALAFGTNVGLNLSSDADDNSVRTAAQAIRSALPQPVAPPTPQLRHRWLTDGIQIEPALAGDVIFRSQQVQDFIDSDQYFFVSANKGCGRTLLMQCKRAAMQNRARNDSSRDAGVFYVPENNPYLDTLGSDLPSLKKGTLNYLAQLRNTRRIWSFAIRGAAISYFHDELYELMGPDDFCEDFGLNLHTLIPTRSSPTTVFKTLLTLEQKLLSRVLDQFESRLDYVFRRIHSGVVMFIDRVDQALADVSTERRLSKDVWINVQAGLIEAAWDIRAANNVKVIASIREEAFASYESDSRANLLAATLQLRYRPDELENMIDHLVNLYEARDGLQAFVGLANVRNTHARTHEQVFDYVLRHTVGRPRDLVTICKSLSRDLVPGNETQFRDTVNEVSSNEIVRLVFKEMRVFLDCLRFRDDQKRLFSLLPYNILTRQEIVEIAARFNGHDPMYAVDFAADESDSFQHPFCELYNCGLVGYVRGDDIYDEGRFRFKKPWDVVSTGSRCLPSAKYYALHPSLQYMIQQASAGPGYHSLRYMPVGDNMRWRYYFPNLLNILTYCINQEICESNIYQVLAEFLDSCLNEHNDDTVQDATIYGPRFDQFAQLAMEEDHDELVTAVKELVSAMEKHPTRLATNGRCSRTA